MSTEFETIEAPVPTLSRDIIGDIRLKDRTALTINDLQALLSKLIDQGVSPDLLVSMEGCDCSGYAGGARVEKIWGSETRYVELLRVD